MDLVLGNLVQQRGASLPPEVALGLLPERQAGHALHLALPTGSPPPWKVPWQLQEAPRALQAPDYCDILAAVDRITPAAPPVAPIHHSYESVLLQTVGPSALDLDNHCSIQEFGREIAEARNMYTNQNREVELPPGRPDYGRQIAHLALPPGNVWGWQTQARAKQQLDEAIETNVSIRQALQRNVQRMQRAMPRAHGEEVPPRPESPTPTSSSHQPHMYHKVKLEIEVVKASGLPDASVFATCDPYVVVSIVDGDPLHDPVALKGFEDWRAVHEQWSGQTRVVEGSREPQFRARFLAEVRNREATRIHFRMLDQDTISQDREIGQAVVPLREVMDDSWAAVRGIALRPMDRKNAQAWAAVQKTRLHVAINWEGIVGKVKKEEELQRAAASADPLYAQVGRGKRSDRRKNAKEETGGLFEFFE
ncbi:unnamed protein product [Effrenium voratum]|nr:unnamed protein product [Effrenium voratum]